jgi:hypothetical protein
MKTVYEVSVGGDVILRTEDERKAKAVAKKHKGEVTKKTYRYDPYLGWILVGAVTATGSQFMAPIVSIWGATAAIQGLRGLERATDPKRKQDPLTLF